MRPPAIFLFADVLTGFGGIETYLEALATTLLDERRDVRIVVSPTAPTPFLDHLACRGAKVYRQQRVPGDRWFLRQRMLVAYVAHQIRSGDWIYCVRQPLPDIYLSLVRMAHRRGAKVAASWMLAPEFLPPPLGKKGEQFKQAVRETDVVISVSECTVDQFRSIYGYQGPVHIVRYHNKILFSDIVPLRTCPPYRFAFLGRIEFDQKNIDLIAFAFQSMLSRRNDIELNFYGGGKDLERLRALLEKLGLSNHAFVHGRYDHKDLARIISENHLFVYTSRFEGGPCLSLLEIMQAGRYVIASPTGGIPDLYSGREDLGLLVSGDTVESLVAGFSSALERFCAGLVNPEAIRLRYHEAFDNQCAHRQFSTALGLPGCQ